jgi:16S rRNA (adenine1518-N6/adenine1519-N6)-dimethyltransferase
LQAKSHAVFFRVVQTAFAQRRKMLRNTLKGTLDDAGFAHLGIDPTRRAEDISVENYVRIANYLT